MKSGARWKIGFGLGGLAVALGITALAAAFVWEHVRPSGESEAKYAAQYVREHPPANPCSRRAAT
jgi:hypothetical protein